MREGFVTAPIRAKAAAEEKPQKVPRDASAAGHGRAAAAGTRRYSKIIGRSS